jgi:hypothetical protein
MIRTAAPCLVERGEVLIIVSPRFENLGHPGEIANGEQRMTNSRSEASGRLMGSSACGSRQPGCPGWVHGWVRTICSFASGQRKRPRADTTR